MRQILPILASILFLGCRTVTGDGTLEVAARLTETAVATGVSIDLAANPDHRAIYQTGALTLSQLLRDGADASQLSAAIQALPIKELRSPTGVLLVGVGISVVDLAGATLFDIQSVPAMVKIATAVRDGLDAALASPPGPAMAGPVKPIVVKTTIRL